MQRKNPCTGSTTIAFLLSMFLLIFTVTTLYVFIKKTWWFPTPITVFGREIDQQFHRTLIITGIVFVLSQLGLAWIVFRYRDRGERAHYTEGNMTMEVLWTLATLVLFVGLGFYAERAWAEVHFRGASPGALQIEVTGQQFAWNFRYAGPDGKFGRLDPNLVNASGGNPLGLDPNDPAGKDDLVVPVMAVPVNREVELILRSQDVTHSFFVRELRLKQDTVPGMLIRIHFTATQVTPPDQPLEIACAELCGLGHYRMRSFFSVLSEADFEKWLRDQAAANQ
jgi:cytochrome c oxidase subunit II